MAARPGDGDPLQMLMAPSDEAFKRAPLIIEPASGFPADSASLSAWCERHRQTLEEVTDVCGALLFRGWGLDEIGDYEACMAGLGACALLETICDCTVRQVDRGKDNHSWRLPCVAFGARCTTLSQA